MKNPFKAAGDAVARSWAGAGALDYLAPSAARTMLAPLIPVVAVASFTAALFQKPDPKKVAAPLLLIGVALGAHSAKAQDDCYGRYESVYQKAGRAFWAAPEDHKDSVRAVMKSVSVLLDFLNRPYTSSQLPPEVCGITLQRTEALAMVWHEKGWWLTSDEESAKERDEALKALEAALATLNGKQ